MVVLPAREKQRERVGSLVVGLNSLVLGDQLVVAFDGHVDGGESHADGAEDEQAPRGGAKGPGGVEVPAGPEARVVFEDEGLNVEWLDRGKLWR